MSWVSYIAILTLFYPPFCLNEIIHYILDDEMPFILFDSVFHSLLSFPE